MVRGYRIHYVAVSGAGEALEHTKKLLDVDNSTSTEALVGGLQADRMYQFEMSAYTRRTEGERTRHRRVRTHGAGKRNRVFTRLSKHQACIKHSLYEATIKQTSSKRRANAEQTSSWLKQAY